LGKTEIYCGAYGDSLRVYAKPLIYYDEDEAYTFGKKLANRYKNETDVSTIEVVFVKSGSALNKKDNEFSTNVYLLNTLSD
ncbi:MAG: hypothetical protein IK068_00415, partial [Lachnospiraceae bacterium]|nr:hypothetical protein [Lachnospiraceae bacterium]